MARYNKTPRTLWTTGGLLLLDPVPCSETTVYLYLRTCDRPTRVAGLVRGAAVIADDTNWPFDEVILHLESLHRRRLVVRSVRPAYTLCVEALDFDLPDKGNDTKGALAELDELPDCAPVRTARSMLLGEGVPEGVWEGVPEGVPKGLRSQEQEQEQDAGTGAAAPPQPPGGGSDTLRGLKEEVWQEYRRLQLAQGVKRGKRITKDVDPGLTARLKEHSVAEVLAVIRWAHESKHPRAVALREGGHLGETLFRASKFPAYLAFAESPEQPRRLRPVREPPPESERQRIMRECREESERQKAHKERDPEGFALWVEQEKARKRAEVMS